MLLSTAKVALQAKLIRLLDVMDTEAKLLPSAPSHGGAVDVDALIGLVQVQREGQFRPCRDVFLCINAASLRRKVPHKSTAAGSFSKKEDRSLDWKTAVGPKTEASCGTHGGSLANFAASDDTPFGGRRFRRMREKNVEIMHPQLQLERITPPVMNVRSPLETGAVLSACLVRSQIDLDCCHPLRIN